MTTQQQIEYLTKMYADCPDTWDWTRHEKMHRPGYTFEERELHAIAGPFTAEEAIAACDAMPRDYNAFARDGLRIAIPVLAQVGAKAFWFGREGSVVLYCDAPLSDSEVAIIFPDADETMRSANPQTGVEMCRVWFA